MNEIELAEMVDHVARIEAAHTPGAGMFFCKMSDEITEHETDLANAELERRGLSTRVVRINTFTLS